MGCNTEGCNKEAEKGCKSSKTDNRRRVYTLNGLPPEVVAVAFAKCSRSPEPFDVIAEELNEDKSRKFHEKWIVGYGHSSVAEHAVLSIAIENVSVIATKVIEDNRLSSFTEKSTRYQVFDKSRYYKPKSLNNSLLKRYTDTADRIMDIYLKMQKDIEPFFRKRHPKEDDVPDRLYEIRIKNKVLDVCRYLLPASILTNLGWTVNARELEYAIVKMMSHPLKEIRDIARDIKEAALKVTPTLVKYTEPNSYIIETEKALSKKAQEMLGETTCRDSNKNTGDSVALAEFDSDAENKLVAALLYRFSSLSYEKIKEKIRNMPKKEKEAVVDEALKRLGKFDRPLRELEHIYYTFDILIDYGAFRDIQRHRMATQTSQLVTARHGYCIPGEIIEAGFEKEYREAMESAADCYNAIARESPYDAQYIVPLGFYKRVLFCWNLRELFHFIKLRSGKTGHISYRRVAQKCYQLIKEKQPLMAKYISVNMD